LLDTDHIVSANSTAESPTRSGRRIFAQIVFLSSLFIGAKELGKAQDVSKDLLLGVRRMYWPSDARAAARAAGTA
jgi:hypothetical protein